MHIRLLITMFLCLPLLTQAAVLEAEARAADKEQAQRQALSDLANSIFVNVQSESSSYMESSGKHQDSVYIKSSSDIPLIGTDINCDQLGHETVCKVSLNSSKSQALYRNKLNELHDEAAVLDGRIAKSAGDMRYGLLAQALTIIEQYEKYRTVAQMLGETQIPSLPLNRADTEAQLLSMEKLAPSIELAAKVLAKGLQTSGVYIYPATPEGSHEVTQFGRMMRDRLAQSMTTVERPDQAKAFLKGEYELLDSGMHLTYRLLDANGNTLAVRIASLAPASYQGLQVKPATLDFDRLLHEGIAVSSDFHPQVTTNRGSENVLFDEQEEVELLVKLNRPGYFYMVGHVAKQSENYSYLLELGNADTDRRFVRYVNADDVNKWLSIGKFEASAPFGVESLQLIATSDDPINRLPVHSFDQNTELYLTASNAQQGIVKTRSLKPKRTESDQQYQGEAVLMFTTMAKSAR